MADTGADWAEMREQGSPTALRAMRWIVLHAPAWVVDPLIWLIALWYAAPAGRATNRASTGYLARVLGRAPGLADRHRHARCFAHVMLDRARFLSGGTGGFRIDPDGHRLIDAQAASGRGAILLGAHFGSFEALRAFDRDLPGLVVRYMMFPDNARMSTALFDELNPRVAAQVISLAEGQAAMLGAMEALERGEFVGFLGDRIPDVHTRAQVAVPFLGGMIRVPTSPYVTAMAARAPIYLCFAPRLGKDHYALRFAMLYDGAAVPRADRAAVCADLAGRYGRALEQMCRDHPFNWFNFFNIWGGTDRLRGADARQPGGGD